MTPAETVLDRAALAWLLAEDELDLACVALAGAARTEHDLRTHRAADLVAAAAATHLDAAIDAWEAAR